jgi:hypothetical protein
VTADESRLAAGSGPLTAASSTCWTQERLEIKAWLARIRPSLAELYEGAVHLLFQVSVPGYARFVAHAVREIGNRLPDLIANDTSRTRTEYKEQLDRILPEWKKAGLPIDERIAVPVTPGDSTEARPAGFLIPTELAFLFAKLVADHTKVEGRRRGNAEKLFIGLQSENKESPRAIGPAIDHWLATIDRFVEITHDKGATDAELDGRQLRENFQLFELALMTITRPFFSTTDLLDEVLEDTNA